VPLADLQQRRVTLVRCGLRLRVLLRFRPRRFRRLGFRCPREHAGARCDPSPCVLPAGEPRVRSIPAVGHPCRIDEFDLRAPLGQHRCQALHRRDTRVVGVGPEQHLAPVDVSPVGAVHCLPATGPGRHDVRPRDRRRSVCGFLALDDQDGVGTACLQFLQPVQRPRDGPLTQAPLVAVPGPRNDLLALPCRVVSGDVAEHLPVAVPVCPAGARCAVCRVDALAVRHRLGDGRDYGALRFRRLRWPRRRRRRAAVVEFAVRLAEREFVDRGVQIHQIPAPVTGGEVGPAARQEVDTERGALAAAEIAADPFVAPAPAARQPLGNEGFAADEAGAARAR
jgi:hypothetical protein